MVSYFAAHFSLSKKLRFTKKEAVASFIIFGSYVPVFSSWPLMNRPAFHRYIRFWTVLCWMTWTSVCTLFRDTTLPVRPADCVIRESYIHQ